MLKSTKIYYIKQYHNKGKYKLINVLKIPKTQTIVIIEIKCGNYDEKLKEIFKIEQGKNNYKIKICNKNMKVNIKKSFSNETEKTNCVSENSRRTK
jgi:hypothetical protein